MTMSITKPVLIIGLLFSLICVTVAQSRFTDIQRRRLLALGVLREADTKKVDEPDGYLTVAQCPRTACANPPGYTGCFKYDSSVMAGSVEEAIANFPDLSNAEPDPPEKKEGVACKSNECKACKSYLLRTKEPQLKRMGASIPQLYVSLNVSATDADRYSCNQYRFARDRYKPKHQKPLITPDQFPNDLKDIGVGISPYEIISDRITTTTQRILTKQTSAVPRETTVFEARTPEVVVSSEFEVDDGQDNSKSDRDDDGRDRDGRDRSGKGRNRDRRSTEIPRDSTSRPITGNRAANIDFTVRRLPRQAEQGSVFPMYTVQRGETDGNGVSTDLCTLQWQWRVLSAEYYPRYINELACTTDKKCLNGYGSCKQRYGTLTVLKNLNPFGSEPNWTSVNIQSESCCDCKVDVGSPLHSWIAR